MMSLLLSGQRIAHTELYDAIVAYAKVVSTESASGTAEFADHARMANARANAEACVYVRIEFCILAVITVSYIPGE